MTDGVSARVKKRLNSTQRPRLKIPVSAVEAGLELLSLSGLVISFLLLLKYYPDLPASIPNHFGVSGEADSWGDKSTLWYLLGTNVVLYIGLTISRGFPHYFNYPINITVQNARRQYQLAIWFMAVLKTELVGMFAYLEWQMLQVALGRGSGLSSWFLAIVLLGPLLSIVLYVSSVYRNQG